MSAVSVVVPTRDAAATLAVCLRSVRAQVGATVELIVVDNHSTDATAAIARRYAHRVLIAGPERSAQRNLGWRAATAPVVLFLDADMVAEPGLVAEVADRLGPSTELAALVVPEQAFGVGYLAACRALEKRLYLGQASVEAARAFTRHALQVTGGFDERLTAFEDWDLTDRVRAAGLPVDRTQAGVWHDEGRIRLRDAFAKKAYYGHWLPAYRQRAGSAPRQLNRLSVVRHGWRQLAARPAHAGGLLMLKSVEAAGIAAGSVRARAPVDR